MHLHIYSHSRTIISQTPNRLELLGYPKLVETNTAHTHSFFSACALRLQGLEKRTQESQLSDTTNEQWTYEENEVSPFLPSPFSTPPPPSPLFRQFLGDHYPSVLSCSFLPNLIAANSEIFVLFVAAWIPFPFLKVSLSFFRFSFFFSFSFKIALIPSCRWRTKRQNKKRRQK